MINHNPYNLPERPPQKHLRLSTENNAQYRRNDSLENSHNFKNYPPRVPQMQIHPTANPLKRSSIPSEETGPNYHAPVYAPVRGDPKHFLPSPKNQHSSSASNLPNLNSLGSPRPNFNLPNQMDKKEQSSNNPSIRESFGISLI